MRISALVLFLALAGCNGSSPTAPTPPPAPAIGNLQVIASVTSYFATMDWREGRLTLRETGGVAVNVNTIRWHCPNGGTWHFGANALINFDPFTNTVPANGQLQAEFLLRGGGGCRPNRVTVDARDQNGNQISAEGTL